MTPRIRPAEPGNVSEIKRVARAAWRAAHVPIVGDQAVRTFLAEHYDEDSIRARIRRDEQHLLVAVGDRGSILGFALASGGDDGDTFHLAQLYVRPDRWGEGIGSGLLSEVERSVRERGGTRLRLRVMADNDRAVRFYEQAGFSQQERIYDDTLDVRSTVYEKELQ